MTSNKSYSRLIVIQTGGTIGSSVGAKNEIRPMVGKNHLSHILNDVSIPAQFEQLTIEVLTPFNLMSEDMILSDWEELVRLIEVQMRIGSVAGIVILHGTDTLSYGASLLSFMLANLPVPLVLTGASYPVEHEASDAVENLLAALTVAAEPERLTNRFAGTFVVFRDPNDESNIVKIFRGTRFTDRFFLDHPCIEQHFKSLGYVNLSENILVWNQDTKHLDIQDVIHKWETGNTSTSKTKLARNVQYLRCMPGLDRRTILESIFKEKTSAVIIDLYHSGTLCGRPDTDFDLVPMLHAIQRHSIPMFVKTKTLRTYNHNPIRAGQYSSEKALLDMEFVYPVKPLTDEALWAKISWLMSHPCEENSYASTSGQKFPIHDERLLNENVNFEFGEE